MKKKWRGVTLVEMMVVVVIIGLLSIISYPKYKQYSARNKRAEAWGVMVELSQFMEKNYLNFGCYAQSTDGCKGTAMYPVLPFNQAPRTGTAYYNITIAAPSGSYGDGTKMWGYQLKATPIGTMAGDVCRNLIVVQPSNQETMLQYADGTVDLNTHTAFNGEWCF